VQPDSSNVQLPVLPDARMDTRNEMRFPRVPRLRRYSRARHAEKMMAKCGAGVNSESRKLHRGSGSLDREDS
jgi:hypothetical protein